MARLPVGITKEERDWRKAQVGWVTAAEGHAPEHLKELGDVLRDYSAIGWPTLLRADAVDDPDHPTVIARFQAYADMGPRDKPHLWRGWDITGYLLRLESGEIVVRDLAIEAEDEGQQLGMTTDVLRQVSVSAIIVKARAYLTALPDVLALERKWHRAELSETEEAQVVEGVAETVRMMSAPSRRRGPRPRGAAFDEQLAWDVLDAYKADRRAGVTNRIAEKYDRSPETVRQWFRRLTRDGWLEPRERGQSVWLPGPRLRARKQIERVLRDDEEESS
jgi:hypothetical protein